MNKSVLWKMVAIIIGCVLLDITLHMLTSAYSTVPDSPDYTLLARLLGTEITASLWALLAFSGVAIVFYRIRHSVLGTGITKGLRYGGAIALLWLFAMLEGVSLFGNSLINEFVVGLSDAIPVLLMGVLLSLFIVENANKQNTRPESVPFFRTILTIGVFAGIFTLGRYAAYFTGIIQSGYQTYPVFTFMWTVLMGVCIGVMYVLLGLNGRTLSLRRKLLTFGLMVFGVNWAVFLVFMPCLFNGFLTDVVLRIFIDVLLVTTGGYLSTKLLSVDGYQEVKQSESKNAA